MPLLALLSAPAGATVPLGCPSAEAVEVLGLANAARAQAGVAPLAFDVRLLESAQLHSEDMSSNGFVSHLGSDGLGFAARMQDAGYTPWSKVGENVAGGPETAGALVGVWLGSPPHRTNLLDPAFTHLGVGYVFEPFSAFRHHWTLDLGATPTPHEPPLGVCPVCGDGTDNDFDGAVDFPADPECASAEGVSEAPPRRRRSCGLGYELVLPLGLLALGRRRA